MQENQSMSPLLNSQKHTYFGSKPIISHTQDISLTMDCLTRCFWWTFWTIYILIFMVMMASIIFLFIVTPNSVKFSITDASLTHFNLTSNHTLYYNFRVNITATNPNDNIKVYYRGITAIAWYKNNDFASLRLTPFDQGHKNTTFLGPVVFEGRSVMNLKSKQLSEYAEETRLGIYNDLAVDFDFRISAKYARFKRKRFHPPVAQCRRLRVPLMISNAKSPPSFKVTECDTNAVILQIKV